MGGRRGKEDERYNSEKEASERRREKEKNKQIERKIEYMTRIVWTIWHHPQKERIERPGLQVRVCSFLVSLSSKLTKNWHQNRFAGVLDVLMSDNSCIKLFGAQMKLINDKS